MAENGIPEARLPQLERRGFPGGPVAFKLNFEHFFRHLISR
jgi:hypothetical protein